MKNKPSMNPCQIGNLFKPGNSLSDESVNYGHMYCVKKSADVFRWGTPIQCFGELVDMLEILKSYNPNCNIFLKVYPDYVNMFCQSMFVPKSSTR